MRESIELLQGTLDLLILKAVSLGPLHGYGILLRIEHLSKETPPAASGPHPRRAGLRALRVPQGSLYPALYRLEARGLIASEWGESENKRKAKFYHLTTKGKNALKSESKEWVLLSRAIASVLAARPEGA